MSCKATSSTRYNSPHILVEKSEIWRDRKEIENRGNINHGINTVIGIPDTEEESNE